MFWATLVNPLIVLISAAAGVAACSAAGVNPHVREMLLACAICIFASEAALVPAFLNRRPIAALIQGTFLGTVMHLALVAILGLVAMLVLKPGNAFVYWLLAIYWLTLVATSAVFIKMVRTKDPGAEATLN